MSVDVEQVQIGGIFLGADGIRPQGGNLATLVPRGEVRDIVLKYGFRAAHPFLLAVFGAVLTVPAVLVTVHLIYAWASGTPFIRTELWFYATGVLGLGVVLEAASRGFWLAIYRHKGSCRKLPFSQKSSQAEVEGFCGALRQGGV